MLKNKDVSRQAELTYTKQRPTYARDIWTMANKTRQRLEIGDWKKLRRIFGGKQSRDEEEQ